MLNIGQTYTRRDGKKVTIVRNSLVSDKFVIDEGYQWYETSSGYAVDVMPHGKFDMRSDDERNIDVHRY